MMKIIIWGLGEDFSENEKEIYEHFEVVAYTDNNTELHNERTKFISPKDISNYEFDKILICSRRFFESIRLQIIKELKIPYGKVMGIEALLTQRVASEGYRNALRDMEMYSLSNSERFRIDDNTVKIMEIVYPDKFNAVTIDINDVDAIPEYSCGLFEFKKKK